MPRLQTVPSRRDFSFQETSSSSSVLTALEEKLLFSVYKLPYLRIDQLAWFLNFSPNSVKWLQKKVRSLIDRKYLDVQYLPRLTPRGSLPHLHMLGTKGIAFFKEKEYPVYYHSPKERLRSFGHLTHALRVSDVILAAYAAHRLYPSIDLASFLHDVRIKHTPCKVSLNNKAVRLHPDAVLDWFLNEPFGTAGADRFTAFVEVDNNEEDVTQITPKIAKYVSFIERRVITNPFGFSSINAILFLATEGSMRRVRQLRTWILQELERLHKKIFSVYFKVAFVPLHHTRVVSSLFVAPLFYSIESDTPMPLIAKII